MQKNISGVIYGLCAAVLMVGFGQAAGVSFAVPAAAVFGVTVLLKLAAGCVKKPVVAALHFIPLGLAAGADIILRSTFTAQLYALANAVMLRFDMGRLKIFIPFETSTHKVLLPMLTLGAVLILLGAAFDIRGFSLVCFVAGVGASILLGGTVWVCLSGVIAGAVWLLRWDDRARAAAVTAGAAALTAGAYFITGGAAALSEITRAKPQGEVTAPPGITLYLRESTEKPEDSESYEKYSESFYKLYQNGFYPWAQTKAVLEAAGEEPQLYELTVKSDTPLIPYGAADCEGMSFEENVGGETASTRGSVTFWVYGQLAESSMLLIDKLEGADSDELRAEGLYRDYVYRAFSALTNEEKAVLDSAFGSTAEITADRRLNTLGELIKNRLDPREGGADKGDIGDILKSKNATEHDYALLTVKLARYFGFGARLAEGCYFDSFPQSGRAELGDAAVRSWAEIYIEGVGWIPFETYPDYENPVLKLPLGDSPGAAAAGEGGKISAAGEQAKKRSLPAQRAADTEKKDGGRSPLPLVISAVAAVFAMLLARLVLRRWVILHGSYERSVMAGHRAVTKRLQRKLSAGEQPPERLYELAREALGEEKAQLYLGSEKAFEKLMYSKAPLTREDAEAVRRAYTIHNL